MLPSRTGAGTSRATTPDKPVQISLGTTTYGLAIDLTATELDATSAGHYAAPDLLAIDEVGYLSYDNRYADLPYEVINARYQKKSTLVTTNRLFSTWSEVFPNSTVVSVLAERLTHHAELVIFEGDSWRLRVGPQEREERARLRTERSRG